MTITRKIVLAYIFLGGVVIGNALISAQTCVGKKWILNIDALDSVQYIRVKNTVIIREFTLYIT
jgi:hypothetical protein